MNSFIRRLGRSLSGASSSLTISFPAHRQFTFYFFKSLIFSWTHRPFQVIINPRPSRIFKPGSFPFRCIVCLLFTFQVIDLFLDPSAVSFSSFLRALTISFPAHRSFSFFFDPSALSFSNYLRALTVSPFRPIVSFIFKSSIFSWTQLPVLISFSSYLRASTYSFPAHSQYSFQVIDPFLDPSALSSGLSPP